MISDQGELFYKLRVKGLTNSQIAERHGVKPHTVGARVSEYRKKMNLPPLPRGRKGKTNGFQKADLDDEQIRAKNLAESERRDDGVLECPKRYCDGYRDVEEMING